MGKPPKFGFLVWFLALVFLSPLHAQTPAKAPSDTNSMAASPAPPGQAPDDMTKKITDLVHAGEYAEAQQLTTGLLVAYPDDQRLIKAKALIDKLLSPAGQANTLPGNGQPAPPAANANAEQLTGMDKVEYNSLIELARQAQQDTDLEQQKASMRQFMAKSSLFLQKFPEQLLLWQLRAASAISLNQPMEGYSAGQKLIASGAADSNDPNLQRLLAQLNNKGWLDEQVAEKSYEQQRYILVAFLGDVGGTTPDIDLRTILVNDMAALLLSRYPSRQIHPTTPEAGDPAPILTVTINVHDTILSPCTYGMFSNIWKCPAQTSLAMAASSLQGWKFNKTSTFTNGTSGVGWGTPRTPLSKDQINSWISQGVVGVFKEILDADAVRTVFSSQHPESLSDSHSSNHLGDPASESVSHGFAPTNNSVQEPVAPSAARSSASLNVAVSSEPAHSEETQTAVLHVYRLKHFVGSATSYGVYIDGKKVIPIENGQTIRMRLAAGKHSISIAVKGTKTRKPINDFDIVAGQEYWVRVDLASGFPMDYYFIVTQVPGDQAEAETRKLEEIKVSDLSNN